MYWDGRPVVPGCAGCAMAHPDFGRSVNPISTRGDKLCPPNYYWHTRIFRPSDVPDVYIRILTKTRVLVHKHDQNEWKDMKFLLLNRMESVSHLF